MAYLKFSIDMIDAAPATTEAIRRERRLARAAQLIDRPAGFRTLLAGFALLWPSPLATGVALPHVVRTACVIESSIGWVLMALFVFSVAASLPLMIVGRFKLDPSDYVASLRDATPDQVAKLAQYLDYIEITTYMSRVAALGRPLLAGEAEMLKRAGDWELESIRVKALDEAEDRRLLKERLRTVEEQTGLRRPAEPDVGAAHSAG